MSLLLKRSVIGEIASSSFLQEGLLAMTYRGARFNAEGAENAGSNDVMENGYNGEVQNENGAGRKFAFDTYYVELLSC